MKSSIPALTLCAALAAIPARAQTPAPGSTPKAPTPSATTGSTATAPGDKTVKAIPPITLPDQPFEAYLLKKENGPFMVMAKVFRGPDAEKMALALCKELRQDFELPAYLLRTEDMPMRQIVVANQPGGVQTHKEVAVLVGNEKDVAATDILLDKVKKLHPKCLANMPSLYKFRDRGGLGRALRTTNPYVDVQLPRPQKKIGVR